MWTSLSVLLVAAVLTAGAAFWVLRAYRRAGGGAVSARPALLACGLTALIALGVYLTLGRPEMPDAPFAERLEALKGRDPTTYNADEALAVLAEAARDNPGDPLPHFYSGQILYGLERPEEAARAYDAALRRDPQLAEAMLGLGRSLVAIEGGVVSPQALALFQQAGGLLNDPAPWIYQAMAAMQSGDDARPFWREALARMRADDPRRAMAQQQIDSGP
ncbi:MAG: tetratricopeptide repeat protein [Hyphomonadaceae bacterium]